MNPETSYSDDQFLTSVLLFATEKHKTQIRKFNAEPYINHPIRVSKIVNEFTLDKLVIATALLHDTIEDTDTNREEIETNFGKEVADMVYDLTNDPVELKRLGKSEYLLQKLNQLSSLTLLVKLADRLDNVSDLSMNNESWSRQYASQTNYILTCLDNEFIRDDHRVIIDRIKIKIASFL